MTSFDSGLGLGLRAYQSAVENQHRANMAAQAAEQQRLENKRRAQLDAKTAAQVALENQRRAELDAQALAQQDWERQRIGRLDTEKAQQSGRDNRRQARLDTRDERQLALENRRRANHDALTMAQTLWEMQRDGEVHGWKRDELAQVQAGRAREASAWEALENAPGAQPASRGLAGTPGGVSAASIAANGTRAQESAPHIQALQQQVELARRLRDPQAYARATQALAEAQAGGSAPAMKPSYDPERLTKAFSAPRLNGLGVAESVYDADAAQAFKDWWGMNYERYPNQEAALGAFNARRAQEEMARRAAERLLREQAAQQAELPERPAGNPRFEPHGPAGSAEQAQERKQDEAPYALQRDYLDAWQAMREFSGKAKQRNPQKFADARQRYETAAAKWQLFKNDAPDVPADVQQAHQAAYDELKRWDSVRRSEDPQGYAAARQRYEQVQAALYEALGMS